MSGWMVGLWRSFDTEQQARAFLATLPAGAEIVPLAPHRSEPKSSPEQRAVAAIERMVRHVEHFERAWDDHGRVAELLWRGRMDRENWAGSFRGERLGDGYVMRDLRDAIEALRIARTLLRSRLAAEGDDAG